MNSILNWSFSVAIVNLTQALKEQQTQSCYCKNDPQCHIALSTNLNKIISVNHYHNHHDHHNHHNHQSHCWCCSMSISMLARLYTVHDGSFQTPRFSVRLDCNSNFPKILLISQVHVRYGSPCLFYITFCKPTSNWMGPLYS